MRAIITAIVTITLLGAGCGKQQAPPAAPVQQPSQPITQNSDRPVPPAPPPLPTSGSPTQRRDTVRETPPPPPPPTLIVEAKSAIGNQKSKIPSTPPPPPAIPATPFTLTTTAFANNAPIPKQYTCYGSDVNPPLTIRGIPSGAKSLALTLVDIDATDDAPGGFVHWLAWNIPATTATIASGSLPSGAVLGATTIGDVKYFGPCPPPEVHRYVFTIHALDVPSLALPTGATKTKLDAAMQGHTIGTAKLTGTYRFSEN